MNKYPIVVGEYTSQCSYAVAGVAEKYKVPYLVVTGAADKITQQGWKYVYRMNPPSSLYNMGVFSFFEQVAKPKSIAILYENTDFGSSTSKAMKEWCEGHGVNVVLSEGYQSGAVDFKPILQKVKSLRPDIVYMVSYLMDASLLMRQSKELDINPQAFIGGAAGFTLPEFLQNAADASEYCMSATLWTPQAKYPGAKEFFDNFKKKFGKEPDYHGAEAYAAAYVLADTLEAGQGLDPGGPPRGARRDEHDDRLRPGEVRLVGPVHEPEQDGHARPSGHQEEIRDGLAEGRRLGPVRLPRPALARPQVARPTGRTGRERCPLRSPDRSSSSGRSSSPGSCSGGSTP